MSSCSGFNWKKIGCINPIALGSHFIYYLKKKCYFRLFFNLVKDSFRFKRKNLRNNLKNYDLIKVEEILFKYDLDLTVRAENLSIEQFVEISNNLEV